MYRLVVTTPNLAEVENKDEVKRALEYMGLEENQPMTEIEIDHVFIGSCTNSRLMIYEKQLKLFEGKK